MPTPDRFSDLRVLRWFDRIDQAIAGETIGPIRASIDLENACNHRCPWCEPLEFRNATIKDRNHTLAIEVVMEVLADLADMDCKTINLSGGGEPTLHPCFGAIVQQIARLHMRSWIVTNGQLMHRWMDDLVVADHVRVSLDASNAKEHHEMHGCPESEFERIIENLVELCKRPVRPEVGIAYIVADVNCSMGSTQRVLELASACGVDFVQFRPLSEEKPLRFTEQWSSVKARIEIASQQFPKLNVFPLGKRDKDVFFQRDFDSCYSAFTNAVVSANGDVVACCDRRDIVFGNVNQQSFKSIWLQAKHRTMAEAIQPKLCSRCLQCGYNRAVERFIVNNEAVPELL